MLRKITVGILLLITFGGFAQEGTPSPYSFYGIGTIKFRGTTEHRSMGGIGVFSDSIHINLNNPASYSKLRLVNLSIGGSNQISQQKSHLGRQTNTAASLDYLSMGIPMGKAGLGFGILPYSTVGYRFLSKLPDGLTEYSGDGGLNRTYLSLAYQVTPEISIGVEANYNFGKIKNEAISQKTELQYGTRVLDESELQGFNFNFGAIYTKPVGHDKEISASVTYVPGTALLSKNSRKLSTVSIRPAGIFSIDEREISMADTDFNFPSQLTVSASFSRPKHWGIGIEYAYHQTENLSKKLNPTDIATYKNASNFRVGGFYIPDYSSFNEYHKRIVYRGGFRFEQSGLNFNGNDIDEFGISFGLGFPVTRLFSNINVGFEFGQRGTKTHGLIKESFFNTMIGFSLNDRWFEKRLYD